MQQLANQLPDSFADSKRVIKSHIPAANAPVRIVVQEGHNQEATVSNPRLKRGRPPGSTDMQPRKVKGAKTKVGIPDLVVTDRTRDPATRTSTDQDDGLDVPINDPRDAKDHGTDVPDNKEISINYVMSRIQWNIKDVDITDILSYQVALELIDDDDQEPTSIYACMQRKDWLKWKEAINVELN